VSNFYNRDLPYGEAGESVVLDLIKLKYPKAYKIKGNHAEFDIMIPETNKTVEVKRDAKAHKTGNVFIETRCNGFDSGLNITTADHWAYMIKDKIYLIKPNDIRLCVEHNGIQETLHYIQGKDIDAYVIPLTFLQNYCIKIYDLTEEQRCQLN
jgi:hypothetical protein